MSLLKKDNALIIVVAEQNPELASNLETILSAGLNEGELKELDKVLRQAFWDQDYGYGLLNRMKEGE